MQMIHNQRLGIKSPSVFCPNTEVAVGNFHIVSTETYRPHLDIFTVKTLPGVKSMPKSGSIFYLSR